MEIIQDSEQTRIETHKVQERQHDGRDVVRDVELSFNEAYALVKFKGKFNKSELVRLGFKPVYKPRSSTGFSLASY